MSADQFREQLAELTAQIAGRALDQSLDTWLNRQHGAGIATYESLKTSCQTGVTEGWLCNREGGGIKYGRIFKPSDDLHGFSVDVVDMKDIAGPHHTHPNGEIDLIMPIDERAQFEKRWELRLKEWQAVSRAEMRAGLKTIGAIKRPTPTSERTVSADPAAMNESPLNSVPIPPCEKTPTP